MQSQSGGQCLAVRRTRRSIVRTALAVAGVAPLTYAGVASVSTGGQGLVFAEGTALPLAPSRADQLGINEAFKAMPFGLASGAGWTRYTVQWFNVQPDPDEFNTFYFTDSDGRNILDMQIRGGMKVSAMVLGTPEWAAETPGLRYGTSVPRGLREPVFIDDEINPENTWGAFMFWLASEYAGRMEVFEIWNEVEIPAVGSNALYNTWDGTAEEYYLLLAVASEAAKAGNPNAQIMTAPYSYFKDKEIGNGVRLPWFDDFASVVKRRGADVFDIFGLNLYRNPHDLWDRYHGAVDAAVEPVDRVGFRARLDRMGATGKPIWLTEINAMPFDDRVPGWEPATRVDGFRITLAEQADYILQAHALAFAAGYDKVFFQALQDDPYPVPDELWGLVRFDPSSDDDDPTRIRPGYRAFQVVAAFIAGASRTDLYVRSRPDPNRYSRYASRFTWAQHLAVFQRGSTRASVVWNGSAQDATIELMATGSSAWLVDHDGNRTALKPLPDGRLVVGLPKATRHFDLFGGDPPGYFYVGGPTFVIVEEGVAPGAPIEASGFAEHLGR